MTISLRPAAWDDGVCSSVSRTASDSRRSGCAIHHAVIDASTPSMANSASTDRDGEEPHACDAHASSAAADAARRGGDFAAQRAQPFGDDLELRHRATRAVLVEDLLGLALLFAG